MKPAQRIKLVIVSLVGISGLLGIATAVPASANAPSNILNDHSGLCIGAANNGDAEQFSCSLSADQTWRPTSDDHGIFQIENGDDSCLDVRAGGAGTIVEVGICNIGESKWLKGPCSSGYCKIISAFDGPLVIGVQNNSISSGAKLVLARSSGAANQKWFWTDFP